MINFEDIESIEEINDISGWDDIDPELDRAGYFIDNDGNKHYISLNDKHALNLANQQKTDGIFQFDTNTAKCCRFDSKIMTDNGYIEIQHLDPNKHKIQYLNNDNKIDYTSEYNVICSGEKELIEITLENGQQLYLTEEHRVLTPRGYVQVCDLTEHDEIIEIKDYEHTRVYKESNIKT